MAGSLDDDEPVELREPEAKAQAAQSSWGDGKIWMRGLVMIAFAFLFSVATTLLVAMAIVQFFWLLANGRGHHGIAEFGVTLAGWMGDVVAFQTGASDEKPFPWKPLIDAP